MTWMSKRGEMWKETIYAVKNYKNLQRGGTFCGLFRCRRAIKQHHVFRQDFWQSIRLEAWTVDLPGDRVGDDTAEKTRTTKLQQQRRRRQRRRWQQLWLTLHWDQDNDTDDTTPPGPAPVTRTDRLTEAEAARTIRVDGVDQWPGITDCPSPGTQPAPTTATPIHRLLVAAAASDRRHKSALVCLELVVESTSGAVSLLMMSIAADWLTQSHQFNSPHGSSSSSSSVLLRKQVTKEIFRPIVRPLSRRR